MFAHARKGHLNHSNNPTYRDLEATRTSQTGSGKMFAEGPSPIANIVSGSYVSASFDKITYISKVHIYDESGNLIGITSMAKPIKKTLQDEFAELEASDKVEDELAALKAKVKGANQSTEKSE